MELSPTCIENALVQSTFRRRAVGQVVALLVLFGSRTATHIRDFQLFEDEELMLFYQLFRLLVLKVAPLRPAASCESRKQRIRLNYSE